MMVERLLLTSSEELVTCDDLHPKLTGGPVAHPAESGPISLQEAERGTILRALEHENGNLASAARRLGISRGTIYRKMCRYGLVAGKP